MSHYLNGCRVGEAVTPKFPGRETGVSRHLEKYARDGGVSWAIRRTDRGPGERYTMFVDGGPIHGKRLGGFDNKKDGLNDIYVLSQNFDPTRHRWGGSSYIE